MAVSRKGRPVRAFYEGFKAGSVSHVVLSLPPSFLTPILLSPLLPFPFPIYAQHRPPAARARRGRGVAGGGGGAGGGGRGRGGRGGGEGGGGVVLCRDKCE